jgi:sarcosine oxidase subunit gamma
VLRELPFLAQVGLRTRTRTGRAAAGDGARALLPETPNTVARAGERTVLWLGPHEWLVVDPPDGEAALEAALASAGRRLGRGGRPVGQSDHRRAAGAARAHPPGQGCSLDLHPRAFAPGQCAQTMVGRAGVILEQRDALPTYRLFVRGSFAGYLAAWLLDALAEIEASSAALRQRSVRATSLNV